MQWLRCICAMHMHIIIIKVKERGEETTKIKTNKAIIHFESQYELQTSQTYNTI